MIACVLGECRCRECAFKGRAGFWIHPAAKHQAVVPANVQNGHAGSARTQGNLVAGIKGRGFVIDIAFGSGGVHMGIVAGLGRSSKIDTARI